MQTSISTRNKVVSFTAEDDQKMASDFPMDGEVCGCMYGARRYESIVFMSGSDFEEAEAMYDLGGWDSLLEYLQQWDYDGEGSGELSPYTYRGDSDDYRRFGEFIVSLNLSMGYCSLERVVTAHWADDWDNFPSCIIPEIEN